MNIKRVYIGNKDESFVSSVFSDKGNLIYSNDNNKGKTIILQSIIYALGHPALFPKGFNYSSYSYVVDIENEGSNFSIYRKGDTFSVLKEGKVFIFSSQSDFKKWFDSEVNKLPVIVKDNAIKIVDFELLIKLFYMGQDRKDSSSLNSGYYKKDDFYNMLHSMYGSTNSTVDKEYLQVKELLDNSKKEKKEFINKTQLLKKYSEEASVVFNHCDKEELNNTLKEIDKTYSELRVLKSQRIKLYNRLSKNNTMLSEIHSIRKSMEKGKIICQECGSDKISYVYDSNVSFDISTDDMRAKILTNIKSWIDDINKRISQVDEEISFKTDHLNNLLSQKEVNMVNLILYKKELVDDLDYDRKITETESLIKQYEEELKKLANTIEYNKAKEKEFDEKSMNALVKLYHRLEDNEDSKVESLFTKVTELYSGSENTVFLISRIIALKEVLNHDYPLIMDGFREGEVSTPTEKRIVDYLVGMNCQFIITATLKNEEYHKYDNDNRMNKIDLSSVESKHLLNKKYNDEFSFKISRFNLTL